MQTKEIRKKWLEFFQKKAAFKGESYPHKHYASASLIPDNPTLLLNAAGMVPFVPIFMGAVERPEPPRAVSIQKCVRVGGKDSDLENIGRTSRHHSFFEMLGNFSFGDYFKQEAITWAWQFVTEELKLDKQKLYVSVFAGDETNDFDQEAYDIWLGILKNESKDLSTDIINEKSERAELKLENRIWRMGRADNFWGPPGLTGPCGPCSEIYYDLGSDHKTKGHDERFVEIWNLVFMQFEKLEDASFVPLAQKNIDTGAGLERLATVMQDAANSFETDELATLIEAISVGLSASSSKQISYKGLQASSQEEKTTDLYLKIIADHLRCLVFLIADSVRPSNLGRGYVLRMIIRRAARFVFLLTGSSEAQLYKYCDKVVEIYTEFYPELKANQASIKSVCQKEEEQFAKTISKGMEILDAEISKASKELSGDFVFDLYSTYGFPLEITQEVAAEKGLTIDLAAYEAAKENHSRASSTDSFAVAAVDSKSLYPAFLKEFGATKFTGYQSLESDSKVLAIISPQGERVNTIKKSETHLDDGSYAPFQVLLDQTPFYGESGGQIGDTGKLASQASSIDVIDTKKFQALHIHHLKFAADSLDEVKTDDELKSSVDAGRREAIKKHHSSCHLLQAALRNVLGDQVQQAGSQVTEDYTRFDFNFERKMSSEEIEKVETLINSWLGQKLPVQTKTLKYEEAIKEGALAFFEDKYDTDAEVRVLFMGAQEQMASIELCGGTHVSNLSEIEETVIASESSVAAGIRRIKLHAAGSAKAFKQQREKEAQAAAEEEKRKAAEKAAQKQKQQELEKKLNAMQDELTAKAEDSAGTKVLLLNLSKELDANLLENLDAKLMKTLTENLATKLSGKSVVALALANEKVSICVAVSPEAQAVNKNLHAGNLVKEAAKICGGGGGGKADFAQAGGRDATKLDEAFQFIKDTVTQAAAV